MTDAETNPAELEPVEGTDDVEDFDAFWDSKNRKGKRVRIMGEIETLPPSLPLQFEMEARRLQRSKNDADVKKLVGILFGADKLEQWAKRGMDIEQFTVLLAWAPRRIAGQPITLAEVAAEIAAAEDDSEGEG